MVNVPDILPQLTTDPSGRALGLDLPAGRLIDETYQGTWFYPLLWLADAPAAPGEWTAHGAAWRAAGLHPVLIDTGGSQGGPEGWDLFCGNISDPWDFDADELLALYWESLHPEKPVRGMPGELPTIEFPGGPEAVADILAPFGPDWPGLARAGQPVADPDSHAAETADTLVSSGSRLREPHLGLVPALCSADIPAAIGWAGSLNHEDDAGVLSAVLRSWEDRFATRVVALTADQLILSVAAPPTTQAEAEAVAAEHFAFCPTNITQGHHGTLRSYATHEILAHRTWSFQWP